jgi:hypothetical protein
MTRAQCGYGATVTRHLSRTGGGCGEGAGAASGRVVEGS